MRPQDALFETVSLSLVHCTPSYLALTTPPASPPASPVLQMARFLKLPAPARRHCRDHEEPVPWDVAASVDYTGSCHWQFSKGGGP